MNNPYTKNKHPKYVENENSKNSMEKYKHFSHNFLFIILDPVFSYEAIRMAWQ